MSKTKKMKEFQAYLRRNAEFFSSQEEKSKMDQCESFFKELKRLLGDSYEIVGSCNKDLSQYLIPRGTGDQISYYGKPEFSFRVSDHWSWYSSLKKCEDERMVQCHSMDLPFPRPRLNPGEATQGIHAYQVAIYKNGKYYAVYGDIYNRRTRRWEWMENSPTKALVDYGLLSSKLVV